MNVLCIVSYAVVDTVIFKRNPQNILSSSNNYSYLMKLHLKLNVFVCVSIARLSKNSILLTARIFIKHTVNSSIRISDNRANPNYWQQFE